MAVPPRPAPAITLQLQEHVRTYNARPQIFFEPGQKGAYRPTIITDFAQLAPGSVSMRHFALRHGRSDSAIDYHFTHGYLPRTILKRPGAKRTWSYLTPEQQAVAVRVWKQGGFVFTPARTARTGTRSRGQARKCLPSPHAGEGCVRGPGR